MGRQSIEIDDEKSRVEMESKGKSVGASIGKKKTGRAEILRLVKSQEYRCALTGVPLEPEDAQLDHIVAVSAGGDHSIENLQVVHKAINRMKGTMDNDEFIKMCGLVARWRR